MPRYLHVGRRHALHSWAPSVMSWHVLPCQHCPAAQHGKIQDQRCKSHGHIMPDGMVDRTPNGNAHHRGGKSHYHIMADGVVGHIPIGNAHPRGGKSHCHIMADGVVGNTPIGNAHPRGGNSAAQGVSFVRVLVVEVCGGEITFCTSCLSLHSDRTGS